VGGGADVLAVLFGCSRHAHLRWSLAQRTVAAVSASSPDQVPVIHRLPVNHALWL
jgi:hypothetical protein